MTVGSYVLCFVLYEEPTWLFWGKKKIKKKIDISLAHQRTNILLEVCCIFMGTCINQCLLCAVRQRNKLAGRDVLLIVTVRWKQPSALSSTTKSSFLSCILILAGAASSLAFGFCGYRGMVNKKLLDIFGYLCYMNNNFNSLLLNIN